MGVEATSPQPAERPGLAQERLRAKLGEIIRDAVNSAIPEPWEVERHAVDRILTLLSAGSEPVGEDVRETLAQVRSCAAAWEPDARIIGNVRAGDIVQAIDKAAERIASWSPAKQDYAKRATSQPVGETLKAASRRMADAILALDTIDRLTAELAQERRLRAQDAETIERLKQDVDDLRGVIADSVENTRLSNEAMDKAINPNGERRDFIPAARELHAKLKAAESRIVSLEQALDDLASRANQAGPHMSCGAAMMAAELGESIARARSLHKAKES